MKSNHKVAKIGCAAYICLILGIFIYTEILSPDKEPEPSRYAIEAEAVRICSQAVKALASWGFESAVAFGARFPNISKHGLNWTMVGESVRFQNGFGAWQNKSYVCECGTVTGQATPLVF